MSAPPSQLHRTVITSTARRSPSHLTLPQAVIALAGGQPSDVHRVQMDVSPLYDHQGHKYGLGSSAASSVALTAACLGAATPSVCFDLAFRAHRTVQHGRGSGADVASSSFGGHLGVHTPPPTSPVFPPLSFLFLPPPPPRTPPTRHSGSCPCPLTCASRPYGPAPPLRPRR